MANNNHKVRLEQQLWNIANTLRGKMGADDFRDYILGFIFYKYLSEKMHRYANKILKPDGLKYREIDEASDLGQKYLEAIRGEALETLANLAAREVNELASQTLLSKDELSLQMSALRALEDLPDNRGLNRIIETSRTHPSVKIRKAAIRMLGDSDDPRAWNALLALFDTQM